MRTSVPDLLLKCIFLWVLDTANAQTEAAQIRAIHDQINQGLLYMRPWLILPFISSSQHSWNSRDATISPL